jgi:hypothetical protein
MTFSLRTFVAVFLLATPIAASAQTVGSPPEDANRYQLFIHDGSTKSGRSSLTNQIAFSLAKRGYKVRSPDNDRDETGGPGVDYFNSDDLRIARDIADVVNSQLPSDAKKLVPRRQNVSNRPGYIGVWLYE